jgi:hypothetical protein
VMPAPHLGSHTAAAPTTATAAATKLDPQHICMHITTKLCRPSRRLCTVNKPSQAHVQIHTHADAKLLPDNITHLASCLRLAAIVLSRSVMPCHAMLCRGMACHAMLTIL